ncbi:MAG: hypothetical protein NTY38_23925 [Acidobacteria bacterium]|nr:hypothetical protein [Acidobacteriota bacterium]
MLGATGSWVTTVCGYAEGQGETMAGLPNWQQTASAFSGCGSVLFAVEELTGLILTTVAETGGFCLQVLVIPDAHIVPVGAEPAEPDLIV